MTRELEKIISIVKDAGALINCNFNNNLEITEKGKSNYVTSLDKDVEKKVMSSILAEYPDDHFISEEDMHTISYPSYWVLDPIDGTTNLIHGYPSVCVSLSHVVKDVVVLGVVYAPLTDELFVAQKGHGAYLIIGEDKTKLKVSDREHLSNCIVGFGCPYDKTKIEYLFTILKPILSKCDDIKRKGPASLDLCYVASGRLDAYLELDLELWDFSAGALILEEAGGTITDFAGEALPNKKCKVVASNGFVHSEMLHTVQNWMYE